MGVRLVERDYVVLREIERWRVCLGRHVKELASFAGQRATDRRLKKLIDASYIERKRYLYGISSVYKLTKQGKALLGLPYRTDKVKIEQITHDIKVLDTAIYFIRTYNLNSLDDIRTEKELHQIDGFAKRKHRPDFVFTLKEKKFCVEVEISLKAKKRIEDIIKANFMDYDGQYWIIPDNQLKVKQIISSLVPIYNGTQIISLEEVLTYVKSSN